MTKPLISVIIPTYKRDFSLLERSLQSALAQTYDPIEVIVVDDNGADSPFRQQIADGLIDYPQVTLLSHETNQGVQKSRNDGILASRGTLIAFLDDDDLWMKNKLEVQASAFTEGVGLVYSQGYLVRQEGLDDKRYPYNMSACFLNELTFEDMLYGDYIGTTTQAMISRSTIATCGMFDVGQKCHEDYELWIRISKHMRCIGVEQYLFEHFIHTGTQLSKDMQKSALGYLDLYSKYRSDYTSRPVARMHVLMLTAKAFGRARCYGKMLHYGLLACLALPSVLLFDRRECAKRIRIHRRRTAAQKASVTVAREAQQ